MGNTVLTSPNLIPDSNRGREPEPPALHFAGLDSIVEEPIWKTLFASVVDVLFPKKLPPLKLSSVPIAVRDPMAVKRSPASSAVSFVTHAVIIGLILLFTLQQWRERALVKKAVVTPIDVTPFIPAAPAKDTMGGGGGGGNHELVEASKGKLPKMVKQPLAPPQILKIDHPKLAVEPAVMMPQQIKLPDNPNMPNIGVPQSPQIALASQGSGSGSGFGSGSGGGIGSGNGNGIGPGTGGGYGGGLYHPGGGVSNPVLVYAPDPEFSDEARRAKYQGVCVVGLIVDAQGNPQRVRIVRPLGMGLDEKALEAVRQYKFKPAVFNGKPVPVEINIEVNFRIY
jgi:protein TonB